VNWLLSAKPVYPRVAIGLTRMIIGIFLIFHGWEVFDAEVMKGYLNWDPFNDAWGEWKVYTGKIGELVCGVLLLTGLFTRIASIILIGTMLYIALFIGSARVWYEDQHPFLFVLFGLLFICLGPGNWAMDHLFKNRKDK